MTDDEKLENIWWQIGIFSICIKLWYSKSATYKKYVKHINIKCTTILCPTLTGDLLLGWNSQFGFGTIREPLRPGKDLSLG